MAVQISRREVLNNIIRFKDNLLERKPEQIEKEKRSYPVLLNRKTGDIRFTQKIESIEPHLPPKAKSRGAAEDWKKIEIEVSVRNGEVHFEICESNHRHLASDGLEPLAYRIMSEMKDALNQIAQLHPSVKPGQLPEEAVLQHVSSIHLSPVGDRIEDLPGWLGSITRQDAEKMLRNRPVGTYLLRTAEELTKSMLFHLNQQNRTSVKGYLCTVMESDERISEFLMIQTSRGWTIYQDDPNLSAHRYIYYTNPQTLLHEIRQKVKIPLH